MLYTKEALKAGQKLRNAVIRYSAFDRALRHIVNAVELGNGTGIFAGVRIIAPSGSGKSLLIECLRKNIVDSPFLSGALAIICTELKESPSVSQLQAGLLDNFNYPLEIGRRSTNNEVNRVLLAAIKEHNVKLAVIDEFQHVFTGNGDRASIPILDWVKRFMNLTGLPVAVVGTQMLEKLSYSEPQFTSRVPTAIKLTPFRYDGDWIAFLRALSAHCEAVDISIIFDSNISRKLFKVCEGSVRPLKALVIQAVVMAITEGEEQLHEERLYHAFDMLFGAGGGAENPFIVP